MNRMQPERLQPFRFAAALALLSCLALAACGQRGPLYLPDEAEAEKVTAEQAEENGEDGEETPRPD